MPEFLLFVLGVAGQALFLVGFLAGRFGRRGAAPIWPRLLAVAGGLAVVVYGLVRHDYVLCLGQAGATFLFLYRLGLEKPDQPPAGPRTDALPQPDGQGDRDGSGQ